MVPNLDEDALTAPGALDTARALALAKAKAVATIHPDKIVIGGDTVVWFEKDGLDVQLAKPRDFTDACDMLDQLSGRTHRVATGVAVVSPWGSDVQADTTYVTFRSLSAAEVKAYVEEGESMDKAGAYALQGGAAKFVEHVEGSHSNVVGLPLELLERMLRTVANLRS